MSGVGAAGGAAGASGGAAGSDTGGAAGASGGAAGSTAGGAAGASGGAAGSTAGGAGGVGGGSPGACPGQLVQLGGSPLAGSAQGDLNNYLERAAGSCVADQTNKQTAIYHFVAPQTGVVTLEAQSSSFGPAVYIWKACGDPYSEVGCWEQGKGNASVEANQDYYVFVTTGWKLNGSSLYKLSITYN